MLPSNSALRLEIAEVFPVVGPEALSSGATGVSKSVLWMGPSASVHEMGDNGNLRSVPEVNSMLTAALRRR